MSEEISSNAFGKSVRVGAGPKLPPTATPESRRQLEAAGGMTPWVCDVCNIVFGSAQVSLAMRRRSVGYEVKGRQKLGVVYRSTACQDGCALCAGRHRLCPHRRFATPAFPCRYYECQQHFRGEDSAVSLKVSFWQALGGHRSNSAEHQDRVQKLKQSGAVALIKPGKSRDQVDLCIYTHTKARSGAECLPPLLFYWFAETEASACAGRGQG